MPYEQIQRRRLPGDDDPFDPYRHPQDLDAPVERLPEPPEAPDDYAAFSGRRESRKVVDKRGDPMGLREQLNAYEQDRYGYDPSSFIKTGDYPPRLLDNPQTQAVDAFIARLEGYQGSSPSRARLIAPNKVNDAVAAEMRKFYYMPLADEKYRTDLRYDIVRDAIR
jgi:hypothetical protein